MNTETADWFKLGHYMDINIKRYLYSKLWNDGSPPDNFSIPFNT
jgi:hypothetical protein